MIMNYENIKEQFTIPYYEREYGEPVWASGCQDAKTKTSFSKLLIPTEGVISPTTYEENYEKQIEKMKQKNSKPHRFNNYFVPFCKNSKTQLAWSKSRLIEGCNFSKTEDEAWIAFLLDLRHNLNVHMHRIQELYERPQEVSKKYTGNDEQILKLLNFLADEQKEFMNLIKLIETHDDQFISKVKNNTERKPNQP